MQTILQVVCSGGKSLRDQIVRDQRLGRFNLRVVEEKRLGRRPGWAKIVSTQQGGQGALNIRWEGNSGILLCRVVNRGDGRPSVIVADFVNYLLARIHPRIEVVTIHPRQSVTEEEEE